MLKEMSLETQDKRKGKKEDKKKKNKKGRIILGGLAVILAAAVTGCTDILKAKLLEEMTQSSREREESEETTEELSSSAEETEVESEEEESLSEETREDGLARIINLYNSGENSIASIDVSAENFAVGSRDTSYAWDRTLFYTLEDVYPDRADDGLINGYTISRKMLWNANTGNRMEYEIYTNPYTGKVNKIVSIEYIEDYLEITDYYYDDNGKVSFIFVRKDINYIPSYAVPTKDGERFYFVGDCMVKWRVVLNGVQANYVIGEESALQGGNPSESVILYASLEPGAQANYDLTEKRMIQAAYNTYQTVLTAKGVSEIIGYVYDENGTPIYGAQVILVSDESGEELFTAATNDQGMYQIMVPSEAQNYHLQIKYEGCVSADIYGIDVNEQILSDYQDTVYMVSRDEDKHPVRVHLYDALNYSQDGHRMEELGYGAVYIRSGMNHRDGGVVAQATADGHGIADIELVPGMYTAEIIKQGYDNTYYNFAVKPDMEEVSINASPKLAEGEVRIVLTWGQTPQDLDSHLFTPYDNVFGDTTYHIWYGNRRDAVGNNLDVDDTDGYGPETMTIPMLKNGLYKYYVADYTNCSGNRVTSYEMSYSGTKVNVYTSNGLTASFTVPSNMQGVIWEVFEIRNGSIVPIQRYYSNIEDKSWWHRNK